MKFTKEDIKRLAPELYDLSELHIHVLDKSEKEALNTRLTLFSDALLITRAQLEVANAALSLIKSSPHVTGSVASEALAKIKELAADTA